MDTDGASAHLHAVPPTPEIETSIDLQLETVFPLKQPCKRKFFVMNRLSFRQIRFLKIRNNRHRRPFPMKRHRTAFDAFLHNGFLLDGEIRRHPRDVPRIAAGRPHAGFRPGRQQALPFEHGDTALMIDMRLPDVHSVVADAVKRIAKTAHDQLAVDCQFQRAAATVATMQNIPSPRRMDDVHLMSSHLVFLSFLMQINTQPAQANRPGQRPQYNQYRIHHRYRTRLVRRRDIQCLEKRR